jgi:hypothetical protein
MNWNLVGSIYGRSSIYIAYFHFIWPIGLTNQKQEIPVRLCLKTDRNEISNVYRGPSIDASHQVSVHLAKLLQRKRFLEIDQSETRMACGGHGFIQISCLILLLYRRISIFQHISNSLSCIFYRYRYDRFLLITELHVQ